MGEAGMFQNLTTVGRYLKDHYSSNVCYEKLNKGTSMEDILKATNLLNELKTKSNEISSHVSSLIRKVEDEEITTSKGVSFLEVKYQLLLSYLVNLIHLLNIKLRGKSLKNEGSIERLVEIRTVLEKIRPIDQKLKYQIDKLVKTAATGTVGENDPLRFKPNPDQLVNKLEDNDGSSSDEEDKSQVPKIYRPPKLAAMHYDGDETAKTRTEKLLEKRKKRAMSSQVMKELKEEMGDAPTEIRDTADLHRAKEDRVGKDRTEYEEKFFMRMSISKKEKNASKQLRTLGVMDDITKFGDFGAVMGDIDEDQPQTNKKKRKMKSTSKNRGGKSKKRRH